MYVGGCPLLHFSSLPQQCASSSQEMWLSVFILFFPPLGLLLGCFGSQAFWLEFEALTQVVLGPRVGTCVRVGTLEIEVCPRKDNLGSELLDR